MIKPTGLQNNMIWRVPNDRPFDFHEPSTRADVPTEAELEESENPDPNGEPGEHAERQHVTEADDADDIR